MGRGKREGVEEPSSGERRERGSDSSKREHPDWLAEGTLQQQKEKRDQLPMPIAKNPVSRPKKSARISASERGGREKKASFTHFLREGGRKLGA